MITNPELATEQSGGWYLLETNRFREDLASLHLRSLGISTYLPRTRLWPRPAVGSEIGPLFPGYLFVRIDTPACYQAARWSPGVKSFVSFDGEGPTLVPPGVVELLERREGPDGLIVCDDGAAEQQLVQVTRGAFRDFRGLVRKRLRARHRVVLLLSLMQRDVLVELPEQCVEPV